MARDWSKFTRRITVNAPARVIYEAWAVPSRIESWFLRSAEYVAFDGRTRDRDQPVETGDAYLWRWHGYLDDVSEGGRVVEANGKDRFVFTFTSDCVVAVDIREENGETVVELTQSNIPEDKDRGIYIDCGYGWAFYLGNLKSVLEGGVDLRNKNTAIKNVINS